MKNDKGITFKYNSEIEAEDYLCNINNYLRTASYRKNYQKHTSGVNKGKYIHLDFAYLKELSTIDMHLRFIIMKMCSDIEHDLKVQLIKDIEKSNEDGYQFTKLFLSSYDYIIKNIERTSSSPYTSNLIKKNFTIIEQSNPSTNKNKNIISSFDRCPIWVLLELLSFGDFIKCYKFYYKDNSMPYIQISIINLVRSIRNCCAHNNCLLNDLSLSTAKPPREISLFVSSVPNISRSQLNKKLKCRPILEFVALIYMYQEVVSPKVAFHRIEELNELFFDRIQSKKNFFEKNELLCSHYEFISKVIKYYLKTKT